GPAEVVRLGHDRDPRYGPGCVRPRQVHRVASPKEVALLRGSQLDLGEDRQPTLRLPAPDGLDQRQTAAATAWDASTTSPSLSVARPESIVSWAFFIPSSGLDAWPATYSAKPLLITRKSRFGPVSRPSKISRIVWAL